MLIYMRLINPGLTFASNILRNMSIHLWSKPGVYEFLPEIQLTGEQKYWHMLSRD
jgi:hypothetical protein